MGRGALVPTFASAFVGQGPGLVMIEDLHWASEPLLAMLDRLLVGTAGPLLIIATARPEFGDAHPGFLAGREDVSTLALERLTDTQSAALLDGLLPELELPELLRGEILAKAEGNPFFIEEMVQRLIDEGAIVREANGLHLARSGQAVPLPDTIHALLAARIDALPPASKRVLQEASVFGGNFWQDPIGRALGNERIGSALEDLESRGLLFARPTSSIGGHVEYAFRHTLVRDVAFASLPKARRARAHAEIAGWLAEVARDRPEELAELIAHHYREAILGEDADLAWIGDPGGESVRRKAFDALLVAGYLKRTLFALSSAVDLHTSAIGVAIGDDEQRRAQEALGDDHESAYRGDDAVASYGGALALARSASSRPDIARLCRKIAWMMAANPGSFRVSPDPTVAEHYIAEGLEAADDGIGRAWLLVARGACARLWRGAEPFGQGLRPDPMAVEVRLAAAEEARSIGLAASVPDLIAAADSALAILHGIAGEYLQVLTAAHRELARLPDAPSRLDQADVLRRVAIHTINIAGDLEAGLELARRGYALAAEGNPHQVMHALWPVLAALYHLGRWDESPPYLEAHVRLLALDPAVDCQFVRDGPVIGATIHAHRGDRSRAVSLAGLVGHPLDRPDGGSPWQARLALALGDPETAQAITARKALEGRLYGPQHLVTLLEALVALGDWTAVTDLIPIATANVAGNALLEPSLHRVRAELSIQMVRPADAASSFRRAIAGFDLLNVPYEAARTTQRLARLLERVEAASLESSAREIFARLGVPLDALG